MFGRALLLLVLSAGAHAQTTLEGPASASVGSKVTVTVGGKTDPRDFATIVPKGSREGAYDAYEYVRKPGELQLQAPSKAGDYEIRVLGADTPYPTLARRALRLDDVTVTLEAPAQVAAGAKFTVRWSGPNNALDYIGIGDADPKKRAYITYAYTKSGNPVALMAPDQPGEYEVRYFLGAGNTVVAARRIAVGSVSASVQAPAEVIAGASFAVSWQGPNNLHDYITIVAPNAREGESGNYEYTARGNPVNVLAPLAPGSYEVRYSTGQSHVTLARASIVVAPGKTEPGMVAVTHAKPTAASGAVEIILDASGSMLQRIGAQRRIDIAKQTLTKLTGATIPAGTPFALRVFGRELDSCQTDLEIPLRPLDPAATAAKIAQLEAKNNAKTPIGASLEQVANDLSAANGERLVILLTDGEETCNGDPAAAIEKLKKGGVDVRVNIVGFAIDDAKLAATFRHWAKAGEGQYFDAQDAAGLGAALARATQPGFELLNAQRQVIAEGLVGGDAVRALPGAYIVRLKGQAERTQSITVRSKETTTARF
jgi:hypothetical protein